MPISRTPKLLVIAPSGQGHHPEYVRWIVQGAFARGVQSITVAGPTSLVAHPERFASPAVPLTTLALPELDPLGELLLWEVGRRTGTAIRRAVESVQPTDVLLTYLDHAQLALATGLRFQAPVRVSGILFRPSIHEATPRTLNDRLRTIRKHTLLRLTSANRHLTRVFTHDPDAVAPLRACGLNTVYLPDPVEPTEPVAGKDAVRTHFEIDPERQLAVLFGSLEARKGVFELLDALPHLAADRAARLAIVLLGRTYDVLRPRLLAAISEAQAASCVQVIFREGFLPDPDLTDLVSAADLVLAPYRNHVGSSGVVLRAAAARTPVLTQDTGLMSREVSRYHLGVTVDTSDPKAIAHGLEKSLDGHGFDADAAAGYAEAHSVETFQRVLFGAPP